MSNNDLKTIEINNIQMDAKNIPVEKVPKKKGRKPKAIPVPVLVPLVLEDTDDEEEKKVEEINQSILEDYKNQMESSPLPPYLEKEIADHKEDCECDLCGVAKVVLECRQEDIKILVQEIPELVLTALPSVAERRPPVSPKTKDAMPPQEAQQKQFVSMETQTDLEPEPEPELPCFECLTKTKRTKKDNPNYWKEYYAENKAKIDKQKKEWREKNKEKVNTSKRREYQKDYDEKNKEKIKARRERIILCECGEEVKHFSLKNHRVRSKMHKLKVDLKIAKGEIIVPVQDFNEDDTSSTASSDLSSSSNEEKSEEQIEKNV